MIKLIDEDNKEAILSAFELFAVCMAAGPCNNCVFFNNSLPEDKCSIGCPNRWPLFDPRSENGCKNRKLVLDIVKRKENKNE